MFVVSGILLLLAGICSAENFVLNFCSETGTISTNCSRLERRLNTVEEEIERMKPVPTDCEEIYNTGTQLDGVYNISPDGRCPFLVFCDMTHGGWTVIQKRFDGSVNFYQPWSAFVEGFGDPTGEHWLGLQKIHRLTEHGVQIYFNMTRTVDQVIDYAHYKYFAVDGGNTQYTMYADKFGYNGTVIDTGLTYHSGRKLSTYDRDNDDIDDNCAKIYGGGAWWYGACYDLGNLNGLYGVSGPGGMDYHLDKGHVSLSSVTMMIKQIDRTC
ncbi:ANGL4-like protein [Mya arenaria]|uniref:ANGL4-like protein n=1 Tax=Mya arenaria TaxID=6604 RepID=A0ABY7FRK0_MYAAR|nr:microfibril-associated glycoprotein 4-like [Mya arenaria]WAR24850.1 ANGL4-like protein [Mya arenaria]